MFLFMSPPKKRVQKLIVESCRDDMRETSAARGIVNGKDPPSGGRDSIKSMTFGPLFYESDMILQKIKKIIRVAYNFFIKFVKYGGRRSRWSV